MLQKNIFFYYGRHPLMKPIHAFLGITSVENYPKS